MPLINSYNNKGLYNLLFKDKETKKSYKQHDMGHNKQFGEN